MAVPLRAAGSISLGEMEREDAMRAVPYAALGCCALLAVSSCGSSSSDVDGGAPDDASSGADVSASHCGNGGSPVATAAVTVVNSRFDPPCIAVSAGSTVTWTNTGMPTHTVTSDPGAPVAFDSDSLGTGGTFSFAFSSPGVVNYHCTPHESLGMKGTVIVE
jgi:plastocyanin